MAFICLFTPFLGIGIVTWKNILVLLTVLALFTGVDFLSVRGKVLCLLLAVIILVVPAAVTGLHTSYVFLQTYLQWCGGNGGDQAQWLEGFRLLHTVVITAAAFLVQVLLEKSRALKIILACVFAGAMLFCLFTRTALTHMGVVFLLLYIVTVYLEWLQEHWKKTRSGDPKAQMIWLAPFLGVYLLLMAVMPAPEAPYDWQWVKNIYSQVKESFLVVTQNLFRGGHSDFSTALSGFSEDGNLGEGVQDDDYEVMHIQAQGNLVTNLYLIGKVYDTFDGRQWSQEFHDGEKERYMDTMETWYAVRRMDDRYRWDYIRETKIKIIYRFLKSEYVFAPLKTRNITGSKSASNYSFHGGDIFFEGRKGYGTEYDVVYYQINVGEELFDELLEAPLETDETLWEAIAIEYSKQLEQQISLEMMEAHRQRIFEAYLGSVTLSKEVESYLSEITKEAGSDLERLRAIERELSSYTYTRAPGRFPDKVTNAEEFLDYFLLESRQGYCTYFATAFVLLARAEGFPARYVQGFCVPMEGSREAAVLSSMAHSWPEVYVEEIGWIPFEPTPGYGGLRYTSWGVAVRDNPASDEAEEEGNKEGQGSNPADPEEEMEADEGTEGQKTEEKSELRRLWRVVAFSVPAILAGFALVLLLDHLLGRRRYQRMSTVEKCKIEVRKNLRVLSWLGVKREKQETLQELRERGLLELGLKSLCFIEFYEDVLYGAGTVEGEALEEIKKEREQLWILLRKENRLTYIFYRMWMFLVRYR